MTPREALEAVRKDLAQAFGDTLAQRIVQAATGVLPQDEIDAVSYREVLSSLCKDERVQGMFGELGVKDKQQRWEKFV